MIDVQNQPDERGIKIQKTGVTKVLLPFFISDADTTQHTVAQIRYTVELSDGKRGTHMSRLMEILTDKSNKAVGLRELEEMLREGLKRLDTERANLEVGFDWFVSKRAPESGKAGLSAIRCVYECELERNKELKFAIRLTIPVATVCPCSKAISDAGAHNQRTKCRVRMEYAKAREVSISNLVELIEAEGSARLYPILKREDEKSVTESGFANAKFVEDVLRDIVLKLRGLENIAKFSVECESMESIHEHNAYAYYEELRA